MPSGLRRFQQSGQSHFVTFCCYHRRPNLARAEVCDLFLACLERMRRRFEMQIYGYAVMPEHVHLLVSEPGRQTLADAIHFLKLSSAKSVPRGARPAEANPFWQKRYYDRNIRSEREFRIKLRYLHRNPVKRGLVAKPEEWKWSSFRHYALHEKTPVEIESEWAARDRELQVNGGGKRTFLMIPG